LALDLLGNAKLKTDGLFPHNIMVATTLYPNINAGIGSQNCKNIKKKGPPQRGEPFLV